MTITLNGNSHEAPESVITINNLIDSLGLQGKPVVVEFNGQALLPQELTTTQIVEGSKVEIVMITAGG